MKTLKTIAVLVLFMVGSVSFAQGPGQGGGRQMRSATERANSQTTRLVKSLGLDEIQAAKVQEINYKYAAQDSVHFAEMSGNKQFGSENRDAMMASMKAQMEAKNAEIKAVLTDEQKTKYDAVVKEMQQRRPG
jgi:hypothetical protein